MRLTTATTLLLIFATGPASASQQPVVVHIPPSAWDAGEPCPISAEVVGDWLLDGLWIGYRPAGSDQPYAHIDLRRAPDNTFVAIVPAEDMQPPGLEYFVASSAVDGERRDHFASEDAPYAIAVTGVTDEMRFDERLARHRGHRSELAVRGEFTRYGRRQVGSDDGWYEGGETYTNGGDWYWIGELEYTYRFLDLLYDIHFGLGVSRGASTTVLRNGTTEALVPLSGGDPGINYGYSGVTLEFTRLLSIETDLIFGASEEGFSAGVGALMRLGRIAGTRLEVGAEVVGQSGSVGFFRFAWTTVPKVPMALTVELNDWPNRDANPAGARMIYELGWQVSDAVRIDAMAGYGARTDGIEGGPVVGLGTAVEF